MGRITRLLNAKRFTAEIRSIKQPGLRHLLHLVKRRTVVRRFVDDKLRVWEVHDPDVVWKW